MGIKVETVALPAYWASALVNGDYTSLSGEETCRCNKVLSDLAAEGWSVVDVARNETGEAEEARFTRHYDLYDPGANCTGGDVLDYVVHKTV